jgi:hypothetical protein
MTGTNDDKNATITKSGASGEHESCEEVHQLLTSLVLPRQSTDETGLRRSEEEARC